MSGLCWFECSNIFMYIQVVNSKNYVILEVLQSRRAVRLLHFFIVVVILKIFRQANRKNRQRHAPEMRIRYSYHYYAT